MSGKALPALRQVLWVAAGAVLLSLLVVAASWLFSPRPSGTSPGTAAFKIPEQKVEKSTFQPEKPSANASDDRFKPEAGQRSQPVEPSAAPPKIGSTSPPEPAVPPSAATQIPVVPPAAVPAKPTKAVTPTRVEPPAAEPAPYSKAPAPQPPVTAKQQEPAALAKSRPPSPPPQATDTRGGFGVQVGAFGSADNARSVQKKMEALGYRVTLLPAGKATKVVASRYPDRPAAERALASLKAAGFYGAFVVPLE